jgi:hypothetical protein
MAEPVLWPKLCPIGVRGDEPLEWMGDLLGTVGIREAVLRGIVAVERARELYADPDDCQFDQRTMAWSAANQWKETA